MMLRQVNYIIYICTPGKIEKTNDKMSMARCQKTYLKNNF